MIGCLENVRSSLRISAVACCVSMIAIGCGGSGANPKVVAKPRASASGKVTIDGKPVVAGAISFINLESGNSAGGAIKDGAYSIKAAEGPNPGLSTVIVIGKEKAGEDDKWQWNSSVTIPPAGYTGEHTITQKETKPAYKRVIDN